jgi:hypothetical protein
VSYSGVCFVKVVVSVILIGGDRIGVWISSLALDCLSDLLLLEYPLRLGLLSV